MRKVKKTERAKREGTVLICPDYKCLGHNTVYHFSWVTMCCNVCGEDVDKYDWNIDENAENTIN